ncbi:MAG: immunoglobulin domain-containing protein [Bacteroidales bacterium]|nr:immunoglobulin domain-containing protein [Bacteroidales bacterium]MCB9013190.1 immunoglobulin domain-containing protein [Bacteroidales bacterium]
MKKNLRSFKILSLFLVIWFTGTNYVNATITSNPSDVTACAGPATVSFSVVTTILSPSYQWQIASNPLKPIWVNLTNQLESKTSPGISGATSANLRFSFGKTYPLTTDFNGAAVRCVISFKLTTETSRSAILTVVSQASITGQPSDLDKIVDQSASFSVTASGSGLLYQWQYDGGKGYADILGATSSSYTIKYVSLNHAGKYRCLVSNGVCSTLYTREATLNVYPVLTIDKQPGKDSGCEGKTAGFAVVSTTATGYQWQVLPYKASIWQDIPGENSAQLVIDPLTTSMNNSQFRCLLSGGAGQTLISYSAVLTVYSNAAIVSSPSSASKLVGESVTFNVSASGYITSYQWKKNGTTNVGTNSPSYSISSVQLADAGSYTCVVTGCNPVTSNAAVLTVTAPAYPEAWFLQTSPTSKDLKKLSVVNKDVAYAIADDADKIVKTTNGGSTWSNITTGLGTFWKAIEFTDQNTGFVAGYGKIMKTINAGTNWTSYDLQTNLGFTDSINDIHFISGTVGWAVGAGGLILKTTDGGSSWVKQNYQSVPGYVTDAILYTVFFVDASNGYAAGENGVILKTSNGGTAWTKQTTGVTYTFSDIEFTSATKGFAVSTSGVYKTTNGGSSWSALTGLPVSYLYSIDFVDSNNGYMAGYYNQSGITGTVLKTKDGGTNWVRQKLEGSNLVYSVEMANMDDGYLVADGGQIHRTAMGGCLNPKVNLYADQELCSGNSIQLVADTFANNLNCTYLWSPGNQTSGKLTVTTSSTYGVTVTNECGTTATDTVVITFNPLPTADAGADVAICDGESAQLLASGGTSYSWNNASYLNDGTISNPVATPPTGLATTFTVTVTDNKGCSSTDAVKVTVNALPTSDFSAPGFVCGTDQGTFTYTGKVSGITYNWDFDGGTTSDAGAGPIKVSWASLGDKIVSLTTVQNSCSSIPTVKVVNVREQPISDFSAPETVCGSSSAVMIYTGNSPSDASYNWSYPGGTLTNGSNQGPIQVAWATPGTKSVSLSVTQNECVSGQTSHDVIVAYPYEGEEICLVTVDIETGKYMVVWERTKNVGIKSYKVYRESNVGNVYEVLDTISADSLSVYVDMDSQPETKTERYYITAVDTCGNESSPSEWHKPLFLSSSPGTGKSTVNLSWTEYVKQSGTLGFVSYIIYRSSASNELTPLDTIASNNTLYVDNKAPVGVDLYYRIAGVKAAACVPLELNKKANSGPFVHSLSNLEDNRLTNGIDNALAESLQLVVYPSPFTESASISYILQKPAKMKVEVYNVVGEKIAVLLDENQSSGNHKLEMKAADVNYISGLYYLKIYVDGAAVIRKTMLSR